ncbi:SusD/RagB family nutrient-binding outer membrane lipoprotein [Parapedobacter sp. ISTM3]|uniref:SusD/RagB family nutrient-binding outer membrane lipoprotein n=1 Tax=Parapedobacter sp. ISTM3 TaxID=2800130 RepID=UPI00190797FE|nr:SusD/RagB family nutrient-binding outer membrane lipoprotein [Parapedobacter sp. ISTM3]MBK1441711.1 SusD/RagB family nutrient-binding outer membrane lipoprotein [Parapedobacter sp. ISTM3]
MKKANHYSHILKNLRSYLGLALVGVFTISCEKFVDINDDPNNPTEPTLNLLLPATQLSLVGHFSGSSATGGLNGGATTVSQHVASGNLNRWSQTGNTFSTPWAGFYTETIPDLETIISVGTEQEEWGYVAIAKLQKAYLYSIMVDVWGDIPYSQAGGGYPNPAFENGQEIYDSLFDLIDEGLSDIGKGFSVTSSADLFFQGSAEKWSRMGKSLKLKLLNQIRLVDAVRAETGIKALIADADGLIDDNRHDFTFQYGTTVSPNARHPWFVSWYNTGRGGYVSMPLIDRLKAQDDPRLRYYIFRMDERRGLANSTNGEGYYGRYPGDGTASPADLNTRAIVGIYPAGGLYDNGTIPSLTEQHVYLNNDGAVSGTTNNSFKVALFTNGDGNGAGILPLITNFMVKFIRAEAALTLNTGEDAKQLLKDGVEAHLTLVNAVSASNGGQTIPPANINGFVYRIGEQFDAADAAGKMELLMMQKWIALYGNGVEAYNDYRRTGLPELADLLAPLDEYPMRFYYSETELTSNETVIAIRDEFQRKQQFTPVFWDVND